MRQLCYSGPGYLCYHGDLATSETRATWARQASLSSCTKVWFGYFSLGQVRSGYVRQGKVRLG
jgi:hypothetical protein